ncbi:zf-HC2 domain-containing protein [Planctomonas sp. JC2975]|uniref:anti-sigma factor family protein n=1 Tax=Planctomonas sp. JC2975 TaxID=2729626 RepID=UPI0014749943|nr:zf-HC2 domain-containing protein [Planctomonas sp. JC2975]NNC12754.1 zf-HC2 domain-containing protein [Planctomonas sp. JC2975]
MNDHDTRADGTTADHERFAEWDAAYVLGALSPSDRRAFEEHLPTCPTCSAAVRDFAGMPGLLSVLPRDEATVLLDDERPPVPDFMPSLLHRVRRRRRARRWTFAGALAAAAVVAAGIALVVPAVVAAPPAATVATNLTDVPSSSGYSAPPITARVTLTSKSWGTSVGMVCDWKADSSWSPDSKGTTRWDYGLWAISSDGTADRVSTWTAGPGDVVRTTGSTSIPVGHITRIELRALDTGAVLLAAPVHASS